MIRGVVESRLAGAAWASGADRIVAVAGVLDLSQMGIADAARATSATTKVIFARAAATTTHFDITHELAHTMPRFLWSDDDLPSECGVNFHNAGKFGNGIRLTLDGREARALEAGRPGILGPASPGNDTWIEQCTYWHLLQAFQTTSDPQLFAVHGWIWDKNGTTRGGLDPGLTLTGEPSVIASDTGDFAVEVRNATGALLQRHPFRAFGKTDSGASVPYSTFTMTFPRDASADRFELVGPTGTLAKVDVPRDAPRLTVDAPASGGALDPGSVVARWGAAGASNLTAWVSLSLDHGATWAPLAAATNATSFAIPAAMLGSGADATVRVVLSNGVLSTTQEVAFHTTGAPPTTTPTGTTAPTTGGSTSTVTTVGSPSATPPAKGLPALGTPILVAAGAAVALLARRRRI